MGGGDGGSNPGGCIVSAANKQPTAFRALLGFVGGGIIGMYPALNAKRDLSTLAELRFCGTTLAQFAMLTGDRLNPDGCIVSGASRVIASLPER